MFTYGEQWMELFGLHCQVPTHNFEWDFSNLLGEVNWAIRVYE